MDDVKNKDLDQQRIFQPSGKEPRGKLNCYDWLADVPGEKNVFDMVEVQFKNTRKGYYRNSMNLPLEIGDMGAVEASPGHDIGRVSLTGKLVALQIKKANLRPDTEIRRVFRKAKASDLEKFEAAPRFSPLIIYHIFSGKETAFCLRRKKWTPCSRFVSVEASPANR